ncbi:MAG TPA: hypothetical protein VKH19_14420 [Gemmatimonadaceae bacterium]|nr:hypothetical protein [Gemmatimonadaceae bacterium]
MATRCPANGVVVSVGGDDSTARARDTSAAHGAFSEIGVTGVRDTAWTFNMAERRWSWSSLMATVGAGLSGGSATPGTAGMTTAPDSAAGRAWNVCAAAAIGMREATLSLRNARGTVHLRTDLSALQRGRAREDSTSRPRR